MRERIKSSVYIVDDDKYDRQRAVDILRQRDYSIHIFETGKRFIESGELARNSCVLLDVRMPDMDGLSVIDHLSRRPQKTPVIMLSGQSTLPIAVQAMKLGAIDFLQKPVSGDSLLQVVERALHLPCSASPPQLRREELLNKVTRREGQVLELLAQGHPNKVVAYRLGIAENTVEVHRQRLMKRLDVKSFAELMRVAVGAGI